MSRIGLLPIPIPQGVEVRIEGNEVTVRGDKGKLHRCFSPDISIALKDGSLIVTRPGNSRIHRSLHGLTRSLLANMVEGVTKGFERVLEISGVGYRVQKADDKLVFQVGYSHPVEFPLPTEIEAIVEGTNRIRVQGINKETVGEVAAKIRAIRPADPYKGRGIKFAEEKLHLKPGKVGKVSKA